MFAQGIDFEVFPLKGENSTRPRIEYALTLECAKHVAMMSRCAKGKQVRDYFIECERRAKAAPQFAIPQTLPDALRLAADLAEQNRALESKVAEQAPKVEALDRIATAEGSLCIRDAAKTLQHRPVDLKRWLLAHQWVYHRPGHAPLIGYQEKIQAGLLEHKVTTVTRTDGSDKVVEQVRITPKGLTRLASAIRTDLQLAM
ncbi:DNA-binding protein [Paraburkholderia sp. UCT2]|nr:DNA-binding protein [Paraburkholderia sp. UCT2]